MSGKLIRNLLLGGLILLAAADAVPMMTLSGHAAESVKASAKVGSPAPNFKLVDHTGKTHSLSDYKGKIVVLEWINFNCPFVKKHYNTGNMPSLQKTYGDKGVVWLSICSSADGKQGNLAKDEISKRISDYKAVPTAYLIDANGVAGRSYGATCTPDMFIVGKDGVLIYSGAIDDKNSADEGDVKTAKNFVKSALDEALAGKPVSVSSSQAYGCGVKYQ